MLDADPERQFEHLANVTMSLVEETVSVLAMTPYEGTSMLEFVGCARDPEFGSWPSWAISRIEEAMAKAAKSLPEKALIEEYNVLAGYHGCDPIDFWDSECPQMDLEMFLDEVLEEIENTLGLAPPSANRPTVPNAE